MPNFPKLFSKKPVAPATSTMTLMEFMGLAKTNGSWGGFVGKFGRHWSDIMLMTFYDRYLRMMENGVWAAGRAADYGRPVAGQTLLKHNVADRGHLEGQLGGMLMLDVMRINARQVYLGNLKGNALAGQLRVQLANSLKPLVEYYNAPPPRAPTGNAPPIPPRPTAVLNRDKAMAFAIGNMADGRSTVSQAFQLAMKPNGQFPLQKWETLTAIWRKIVTGAPAHRMVNFGEKKYGSSMAGTWLMKEIINDFNTTAQPQIGDEQWYDWALYFLAAVMTSQGFPDGNKRAARVAYGLVLLHGGVEFKAPSDALGARLGDM